MTAKKGSGARRVLVQSIYTATRKSSFEKILVNSIYRKVATNTSTAKKTTAAVKKTQAAVKKIADTQVTGAPTGSLVKFQPNGFYFSASLDFALAAQEYNVPSPALTAEEKTDWGTGYGNPLVNPKKNCIYVVRVKLDQLRVDPMMGGFKLEWTVPAGWTKLDSLPMTHYVEAASNPLLVARKFLSPATPPANVVFRVRVLSWYP